MRPLRRDKSTSNIRPQRRLFRFDDWRNIASLITHAFRWRDDGFARIRPSRSDTLSENKMNVGHSHKPKYDPKGSWLYISVVAVLALGSIGPAVSSYLAEKSRQRRANWPQTAGRPIGTRVIRQPPTRRFRQARYVQQCSVEYVVDGKRYTLWAASGYLDPDATWVVHRVRDCPVSQYAVHYNPKDPSDASAE